jgi:serine/threonine protein kinase
MHAFSLSSNDGPFAIGRLVAGTYEITGRLAAGGMGVVYDARDIFLSRRVALKVPISPRFAPALEGEALALASLRSSAFATVYQLGRDGDVVFMAMERIFGETLEAYIDETRAARRYIPIREALHILTSIASALVTAHAAGFAQRDVKPANVILAPSRIVLVDFGLSMPEVLVGPENEVNGSADYIAPEVLRRGVTRGGGVLVDLYALGVLAFELLIGHPPFVDPRLSQTLRMHLVSRAPDVCALRSDVPPALGALVGELLSKDPLRRPVSAEAVMYDLLALE